MLNIIIWILVAFTLLFSVRFLILAIKIIDKNDIKNDTKNEAKDVQFMPNGTVILTATFFKELLFLLNSQKRNIASANESIKEIDRANQKMNEYSKIFADKEYQNDRKDEIYESITNQFSNN